MHRPIEDKMKEVLKQINNKILQVLEEDMKCGLVKEKEVVEDKMKEVLKQRNT